VAQPLVILGTHWLAEEIFDLVSDLPEYEVTAFIENWDRVRCDLEIEGRPVLWVEELAKLAPTHLAMCALGTTQRRGFIEQAEAMGMRFRHGGTPQRARLLPRHAVGGLLRRGEGG